MQNISSLQSLLKKESLTETIRRNPERYVSPLPIISYNIINYSTCSYGQWQPTDYFDIQSNLIEDATKLFEKKLAKSLETSCNVNISQPSLPSSTEDFPPKSS